MELDDKQIKAIILTVFLILIILLIFVIASVLIIGSNSRKNNDINISGMYTTIKELVESFGCKYKNDTYSENRDYPTEVSLIFKEDLYENDESNEKYYTDLINALARFLKYTNVKMLDESRDITIEVICKNGKIDIIKINGIEDYFIYMESQKSLSQYKELKTNILNTESEALNNLISNNWESSTELGTRESIFRNYNVYLDEGFKYKKIGSKIYNIIFDRKYNGEVINTLPIGIDFKLIKDTLGEPTFEDKELEVIGYKGTNFYAFFTKNEVSIYRNETCDYTDFWKLIDKFLEDKLTFKEFMNELTYLWPDYSEYTYDKDYMFISYPNRGIDVKLNYDEISGIIVYNNISENLNTVKKYLSNTELISRLQIDNVFEAEKRRLKKEKELSKTYEDFRKELDKEKIPSSSMYDYYIEYDSNKYAISTYFIPKTSDHAPRELNEGFSSYVWLNDIYFAYGISGKGIYYYNVETGERASIKEGRELFKIESFENNLLKYDDEEILLEIQ